MSEGLSGKFRNWLDPKTESPNRWKPYPDAIVRLKVGTDFDRAALERAGISLNPKSLYQIKEYKGTDYGYLLYLNEVNVQHIMGKRLVNIIHELTDPLNIDLFELLKPEIKSVEEE